MFHALLCFTNLVCLGFSSVFDTMCAVKQDSSVVNCTEKIRFINKPQPLVIIFHLTVMTNAIVVMTTLYLKPKAVKFCGIKSALKQLVKKGAFWSFNILFFFVVSDYVECICCHDFELTNKVVAATMIVFYISRLIAAFFLNYVIPVKLPVIGERTFTRMYFWLAYWTTLVLFLLDSAEMALAVTLDVAEKLSPLGRVKTGSKDFTTVYRLILLGIKATFEGRLFIFFWNKFFHGSKDLFSTFIVLKPIKEEPAKRIENGQNLPSIQDRPNATNRNLDSNEENILV